MKIIIKIIKVLIILFIMYLIFFTVSILYTGYKKNFFNEFTKAELHLHTSKFSRNSDIKYGKYDSYEIKSEEFNDAMFYKNIEVTQNTAYKVSCKIKTDNVLPQSMPSESGAHISIADTTEKSKPVQGTTDWQEVELYFNSKNRNNVNIAFRLGGYQEDCKGTAWFTDFKLEKGAIPNNSTWNVACFILKNIDVNVDIDGKMQNVKVSMNYEDIYNVKDNMRRFKYTCEEFSNSNINILYNIYEINDPITSIDHDEQNGYYISGKNVSTLIDTYLDKTEYDHIFTVVKFGDLAKNIEVPVNDWLGLGSMVYRGIGFSNIRIPSDSNNKLYVYNSQYNTLPEEVFVHEFLHDLERISQENGYEVPVLHSYEQYGYKSESRHGLKKWYEAYMSKTILDTKSKKYVGIDPNVYKIKPVQPSGFAYTIEIKFIDEPENVITQILKMLQNTFNVVTSKIERKQI